MTKNYCDACGAEIKITKRKLSIPIHITGKRGSGCSSYLINYNNDEFIPTSGIDDEFDLCQKCQNKIMNMAWNEFKKIRIENNINDNNEIF